MLYPQKGSIAIGSRAPCPPRRSPQPSSPNPSSPRYTPPAPVERLVHQRHRRRSPPSKDERADWHSIPDSSHSGSMVGHCDAGAVKRPLGCAALAPSPSRSPESSGCPASPGTPPAARPSSPPTTPRLRSQRNVGEDRVAAQRRHRIRIGLRLTSPARRQKIRPPD